MFKTLHTTRFLAALALLSWASVAQALSLPPEHRGGWCSPGSKDPEFFTTQQGATMGIIQCKLQRVEMDPTNLRASLLCTNFTGRFVEPMSLEISRGRLRVDGARDRLWKCL